MPACASVFALLLAPTAGAAPAGGPARVFVVELCDDDQEIVAARRRVSDRLAADGWQTVDLVPPDLAWSRSCGRLTDAATDVEERLIRGQALLAAGKLAAARVELAMPRELAEGAVMAGGGDAVRDTWLRLAELELAAGDESAADEALREVGYLWPTWRPQAGHFAAGLATRLEEAWQSVSRPPLVELWIGLRPAGARVWLNGSIPVPADGRLVGVAPGINFLTVRDLEHGLLARAVTVGEAPRAQLRFNLESDQREAWAAMLAAGAREQVLTALDELRGEAAVLLVPADPTTPSAAPLAFVAVRSPGAPSVLRVLELPAEPRLAARTIAAVVGPPPDTGVAPSDPTWAEEMAAENAPPAIDPVRDLWWVWAGLAVVVVGVGTGLTVHAIQSQDRVAIEITW